MARQIPDWLGGTAADCPLNEGGDVPLGIVNKNAMESEGAPMIDLDIKHGALIGCLEVLIGCMESEGAPMIDLEIKHGKVLKL